MTHNFLRKFQFSSCKTYKDNVICTAFKLLVDIFQGQHSSLFLSPSPSAWITFRGLLHFFPQVSGQDTFSERPSQTHPFSFPQFNIPVLSTFLSTFHTVYFFHKILSYSHSFSCLSLSWNISSRKSGPLSTSVTVGSPAPRTGLGKL